LVDLANLLGGPDNITVIVAEVLNVGKLGKAVASESAGGASAGISSSRFSIFAFVRNLFSLLGSSRARPCSAGQPPIGSRGKAPYRCHDCSPNTTNIGTLEEIVRQLEELESRREWDFDWKPIHENRLEAQQAGERGDYEAAVVGYCKTVRMLMEELRNSSPEPSSDSSIGL